MDKKIILLITICTMLLYSANITSAAPIIQQKEANSSIKVENTEDICEETDIIKRISLKNKLTKSPEAQIIDLFKKYNKYSMKNNIEKLKDLYSDSYVNNDGFNKNVVFTLMDISSDVYEDINYNTEIESIKISGNYAVVKVHEIASGKTNKKMEKVNDTGMIISDMYYTDYLQKESNKWKITATDVTYEEIKLKYGETKNTQIDIYAPDCVSSGSEYEAKVTVQVPNGSFLVGSIVNEPIVYPQVQNKDVYRSINSGELARILKANKDNNNEYATASIALTRAEINPPEVLLNMTGIAFVMKRVNIIQNKNINPDKETLDVSKAN